MTHGEHSAGVIHGTEQSFFNQTPAEPQPGLTKREDFAKAAMQGLLANNNFYPHASPSIMETYAEKAILMADALISQLNK